MIGVTAYVLFEHCLEGSPLDADFLHFYQTEVKDFSVGDRLFGLIGHLPDDSQTMYYLRGGENYTFTDSLISRIEFLIHSYMYSQSEKKNKANKPVFLVPDYMQSFMPEEKKHISELSYEEVQALAENARNSLRRKKRAPEVEEPMMEDNHNRDVDNNNNDDNDFFEYIGGEFT